MKITDVQFTRKSQGQTGLVMPGNYWVTEKTFRHVHAAVLANWQYINWSVRQTAKSVVGKESWSAPAERGLVQAMGRCVRYLVRHNMLPQPLRLARKRNGEPYKGGSRMYVLCDGAEVPMTKPIAKSLTQKSSAIDARTIRINPSIPCPA